MGRGICLLLPTTHCFRGRQSDKHMVADLEPDTSLKNMEKVLGLSPYHFNRVVR